MLSEKDQDNDESQPRRTESLRAPRDERPPSLAAMVAVTKQELDSYDKPSVEYRLKKAEEHKTVLGWCTGLLIVLFLVAWGLHTSQRTEMLDELDYLEEKVDYLEGQVECFVEAARIADLDLARSC